MRVKDEVKQKALFEATIKVVNQIGFAASSISKIAGEAGISPATIYIYHENKEELLVSTYVEIKRGLGEALLRDFDESRPIRDTFKQVWTNGFAYVAKNRAAFDFAEQFANSPYSELVNRAEVEKYFEPLMLTFQRGVQQKIIKDISFDLISAFLFYPLMYLSNRRHCSGFELTDENIDLAFNMAWDAIKL